MNNSNYGLASVIVPIYKVEKYLRRCIDSILNQTYKNIEVILVDDGSPDKCGEICDEYEKIDSRVRVIHKENGGLSEARNFGLLHAVGEYVFFVDSDDWIDRDYCSSAILDLVKENVDVVIFGYNKIDEDGNLVDVATTLQPKIISTEDALRGLVDGTIANYAWNKIYKRRLFSEIEYPVGRLWEDVGTTYRVFDKCESLYLSNRVTYNYLVRKNGITGVHSSKADIDIYEQRKEQYNFFQEKYPEIAVQALSALVDSAIQALIHIPYEKQYDSLIADIENFLLCNKSQIVKANSGNIKVALFYKAPGMFRKMIRYASNIWKITKYGSPAAKICRKVGGRIKRIQGRNRDRLDIGDLWKTQKHKIYLIGTPDHDNLGDHAIALSSIQFLQDNFKQYEVIDITEQEYWKYRTSLIKNIDHQCDKIVLQGGGNLGNQYKYIEKIRRDVVSSLSVPLFLFPQTMYFTPDEKGKKELSRSKKIYGHNTKLIMYAREEMSYDLMRESFPNNKVYLVPDIVLRYRVPEYKGIRSGILLCLRTDKETSLTYSERESIKTLCLRKCEDVSYTDTCIREYISKSEREDRVYRKLVQISSAKLMITDRLHGMVFALLTKTPCIVLANYNHKIEGVYQWIKHNKFIYYMNNLSELESKIDEMFSSENITFEKEQFDEEFKKIMVSMTQD